MVSNPMQWIEDLKKCGCNQVFDKRSLLFIMSIGFNSFQVDFHIEAVKDHDECLRVCQAIREKGMLYIMRAQCRPLLRNASGYRCKAEDAHQCSPICVGYWKEGRRGKGDYR